MAQVHPTAVVDPAAKLADHAEVGPYAVVGGEVSLAQGVVVASHVVLEGRTTVGPRTRIHPFCVIGGPPQVLGASAGTGLSIGADNEIREYTCIHTGSVEGGEGTRVGDGNFLLHGVHVAHDCHIGDGCVLASQTALAGHARVDDHAVLGGQVGVHQFCRIGESAFVGAASKLRQDAPPFARVVGQRPRFAGLNELGLGRRGFSEDTIATLRRAYHLLFRSHLRLAPALARVRRECGGPEVERVLRFFEGSQRGIIH